MGTVDYKVIPPWRAAKTLDWKRYTAGAKRARQTRDGVAAHRLPVISRYGSAVPGQVERAGRLLSATGVAAAGLGETACDASQ